MTMTTALQTDELVVDYDESNHSATASRMIAGEKHSCTCYGLARCGEPYCEPANPFPLWILSDGSKTDYLYDSDGKFSENSEHLYWQKMREAAVEEVQNHWHYDGSIWSPPVVED
jgi:hypothetical protein